MLKINEFPPSQPPDYAGHVVMLNPAKAKKFQCYGLGVGLRNPMALVPTAASMAQISKAIAEGILIDITERPDLWENQEAQKISVDSQFLGKKSYCGPRKVFRDLGLDEDLDAPAEELVCYSTEDAAEQKRIETALRLDVSVSNEPPVRFVGLSLPPGMDDPEKYLLHP